MNSLKNNFKLDISKLTLGSSSKGKLEEYKGFNLPFNIHYFIKIKKITNKLIF